MEWVKLYRNITQWELYKDANAMRVFLHLTLMAQYGEYEYKGIELGPGQFISSPEKIGEALGLSRQQVRTAMQKLIKSGSVQVRPTNKFTVYTVVHYADYQGQKRNQQNPEIQPSKPGNVTNKNAGFVTNKESHKMHDNFNESDDNLRKWADFDGDEDGINQQKNHMVNHQNPETQPTKRQNVTTEQEEYKQEEDNKKKERGAKAPQQRRFVPPTVDEVRSYCESRNNRIDPNRFCDYYQSKGWMVGKTKMKDWRAAVRTWESRDRYTKAKVTKPSWLEELEMMN